MMDELESTLLERAKEGDMNAMKTLIKYQAELGKKADLEKKADSRIDLGKFTDRERVELKKFVEAAITEIRAKLQVEEGGKGGKKHKKAD